MGEGGDCADGTGMSPWWVRRLRQRGLRDRAQRQSRLRRHLLQLRRLGDGHLLGHGDLLQGNGCLLILAVPDNCGPVRMGNCSTRAAAGIARAHSARAAHCWRDRARPSPSPERRRCHRRIAENTGAERRLHELAEHHESQSSSPCRRRAPAGHRHRRGRRGRPESLSTRSDARAVPDRVFLGGSDATLAEH